MAVGSFEKCFRFVCRFEGGFVNDPKDPGGPTNLGITQATLSSFLGRAATIAEVKALTPDKAAPIYREKYWDSISGDDLPTGIDLLVFDYGVHAGPRQSVLALQRVLRVVADGRVGPRTILAARKADPMKTIDALSNHRVEALQKLKIWKDERFHKGLISRVEKARKAALSMI